ncbi:MAG: FtsX-like permease family protein [Treponema sp.]|jgi:ABC-type lipoprotein release transport system permease subunit|nr:FtsX-like permease family protein [Treponema sp.]
MKLITMLLLAAQYLFRYRRRYLFLFLALAFGFGIISFIRAAKDGMAENVYFSARGHYAGDIVIRGDNADYSHADHFDGEDTAFILETAEQLQLDPSGTAVRTDLYGRASVYFNGAVMPLKYVQGIDWENEAAYFSALSYDGLPGNPGDDTMLLSEPLAKSLGIRQGDSVVLETETGGAAKNTGVFVIAGIIRDSSIFGYYKAYIARETLNSLIGFDAGDCSFIGFTFKDHSRTPQKTVLLRNALAQKFPTAPFLRDREDYNFERSKNWEGLRVFVLTIPVFLSEVDQLLNAMDILSYLLYGMMLIIIMVSAGVTYRLILHERVREIGTMRAIGFYERDVQFILVLEALGLGILSLIAGFFFARLLSAVLARLSFAWFPGFEIFLRNGRLTALYLPKTTVINILAVFCMLLPSIWFLSFRVTRNHLPLLLNGDTL